MTAKHLSFDRCQDQEAWCFVPSDFVVAFPIRICITFPRGLFYLPLDAAKEHWAPFRVLGQRKGDASSGSRHYLYAAVSAVISQMCDIVYNIGRGGLCFFP